ncbi:hypothetical protein HLK59_36755 [Streptomyces sp. S3(2020)]|uniref:hypothetical protein n=1 Tax=Streptomyces sp. S3(2020) TaxID=2732044 RepID=UPI00148853FF|nr:hypothetical protein [Streptomyces sp. S3(2020)]NNN35819.1 hypothetical protein [Streptomyces sp. S3(2020)]
MVPVPVFLLLLGLAAVGLGGRWAFNVRGAADAWAERAKVNTELRAAAAGDLGPPRPVWTARRYRVQGARMFACGLVLLAAAFLELWL